MVYNVKTIMHEIKVHNINYSYKISELKHKGIQIHMDEYGRLYNENITRLLTIRETIAFMNNYTYTASELYFLLKNTYNIWQRFCFCLYIDNKTIRSYFNDIKHIDDRNNPHTRIIPKVIEYFDLYVMFTFNHIYNMCNTTGKWSCVIKLICKDLSYVNTMSDHEIYRMALFGVTYTYIDTLFVEMLLMSEVINKHKINRLLEVILRTTYYNICYEIHNNNRVCNLDMLKTILAKYVDDDNAIDTLCGRYYNMKVFYLYASMSKSTFHISELNFNTIYQTKIPDIISGKYQFSKLCNSVNGRKFIKYNPDRIIINKSEVIKQCIKNNIVIDIFVKIPELLKYCIYYKKSFNINEIQMVIDVYRNNDITLTTDMLIILLGKSKLNCAHDILHELGTIIEHIE